MNDILLSQHTHTQAQMWCAAAASADTTVLAIIAKTAANLPQAEIGSCSCSEALRLLDFWFGSQQGGPTLWLRSRSCSISCKRCDWCWGPVQIGMCMCIFEKKKKKSFFSLFFFFTFFFVCLFVFGFWFVFVLICFVLLCFVCFVLFFVSLLLFVYVCL